MNDAALADRIASRLPMAGWLENDDPSELTRERVHAALQRVIDDIARRSMTSRSGLAVCAGFDASTFNVSRVNRQYRSPQFVSMVKLADAAGLTMAEFGELFDVELARA